MKSTIFYENPVTGATFFGPKLHAENCGLVSVCGLFGAALGGACRV
jgi:hypothetical protein